MYKDGVLYIRTTKEVKRALELLCHYTHKSKTSWLEETVKADIDGYLSDSFIEKSKENRNETLKTINNLRTLVNLEPLR